MKLIANKEGLANYLKSHPHTGGIIVSEQKKFVYMKPTKTAGTSILRNFLQEEVPDIFFRKSQPEKFGNWLNNVTDADLEEYFIFTVVRNPWDRFVSSAKYLKIPFEELLENFNELIKDTNTYNHTLPLYHYSHNNGVLFADFVCRMECLQADMNLVCDYIKVLRRNLPVTNTTKHKHYSYYYDDDQLAKVAKIYKQDIEFYGYAFNNVRQSSKVNNTLLTKIFK